MGDRIDLAGDKEPVSLLSFYVSIRLKRASEGNLRSISLPLIGSKSNPGPQVPFRCPVSLASFILEHSSVSFLVFHDCDVFEEERPVILLNGSQPGFV